MFLIQYHSLDASFERIRVAINDDCERQFPLCVLRAFVASCTLLNRIVEQYTKARKHEGDHEEYC